jgi:hypothetical protein
VIQTGVRMLQAMEENAFPTHFSPSVTRARQSMMA